MVDAASRVVMIATVNSIGEIDRIDRAARKDERAKIVAWIRSHEHERHTDNPQTLCFIKDAVDAIADDLERGEHLK